MHRRVSREGEEERKGRVLTRLKYISIYRHEDIIMKPTKHYLKKEGRGKGRYRNIMGDVNLFKVCCMHVWNYHKEISHTINVC
jgi:hypothetical protein